MVLSLLVVALCGLLVYLGYQISEQAVEVAALREEANTAQHQEKYYLETTVRLTGELEALQDVLDGLHDGYRTKLENEMELWRRDTEAMVRKDAIQRSKTVIHGQSMERLAPFLMPDINPKDCQFVGQPIDYICFDGMSKVNNGDLDYVKIRFIEIKTGDAQLNKIQRRIRSAITAGSVTFETFNPDTGEIS